MSHVLNRSFGIINAFIIYFFGGQIETLSDEAISFVGSLFNRRQLNTSVLVKISVSFSFISLNNN